jgi:hypothetical protein
MYGLRTADIITNFLNFIRCQSKPISLSRMEEIKKLCDNVSKHKFYNILNYASDNPHFNFWLTYSK